MNAKTVTSRIDRLKDLGAHLSEAAFREAAAACRVFLVDDRLAPEDEVDLLADAMADLTQAQIADAARELGLVPEGAKVAFKDKEPKINGPKVNCEKPVPLSLPGPWIDQSKMGWAKKWAESSVEIRNALIALGQAECANGECTGAGKCSFIVDDKTGIEYRTETDPDNRTMRIRPLVTVNGKCVCPKRPATGDGQ